MRQKTKDEGYIDLILEREGFSLLFVIECKRIIGSWTLSLSACSTATPITVVTPTSQPTPFATLIVTRIITSEVTRIVQVTPTQLYTSTPTLNATQLYNFTQ